MVRLLLSSLLLVAVSFSSFSQSDSIVLRIENKSFTRGEFDFIYKKNNQLSTSKKSEKEYLDLFVNYKLKVHEAENLGYDTIPTYKEELSYYKEELAKPYLSDKSVTDELVKEAYAHLENEVNASHILILIPRNPVPADTVIAYNKIVDLQRKISNGVDFNQLATEYSEDPSAAKNGGHLGYFTGFMMVYPFEKAAFQTPVGQVSPIVRTQFGYHLIFVHSVRKARGELRVAHIMKMFPRNSSQEVVENTKLSIDTIYNKLLAGEKFEDLAALYSEDGNTARKGGELPWFSASKMIPEFADPAFELKTDGEISKPILTPYGWHIIKRLEHKGIASYESMKPELETRIAQDERAFTGQKAVVSKLKREYGFKNDSVAFNVLKTIISNLSIQDSIFYAEETNNTTILFSFSGEDYSVADFKIFLQNKKSYSLRSGTDLFTKYYIEFQDQSLLNFEKNRLAIKYPDYKYLLSEYHDGLLIFEISKDKVWDVAASDTVGLKTYYTNHKSNFNAPKQFIGRVFYCLDKPTLAKLKPYTSASIAILDSVLKVMNQNGEIASYLNGSFAQNENAVVDAKKFKVKNGKEMYKPNLPVTLLIGEMQPPRERTLEEAKGAVISDYQSYLDLNWIKSLREKYKPEIGPL